MKIIILTLSILLIPLYGFAADTYLNRINTCEFEKELYVIKTSAKRTIKSKSNSISYRIDPDGEKIVVIDAKTLDLLRKRKMFCTNVNMNNYEKVKVFDSDVSKENYILRKKIR